LMPMYVKKFYANDPHFSNTKLVYSIYDSPFEGTLDKKVANKLKFDGFSDSDVSLLKTPDFVNLTKTAINFSDAVIHGSAEIDKKITAHIKETSKPSLVFHDEENYIKAYNEFYEKVAEESAVFAD